MYNIRYKKYGVNKAVTATGFETKAIESCGKFYCILEFFVGNDSEKFAHKDEYQTKQQAQYKADDIADKIFVKGSCYVHPDDWTTTIPVPDGELNADFLNNNNYHNVNLGDKVDILERVCDYYAALHDWMKNEIKAKYSTIHSYLETRDVESLSYLEMSKISQVFISPSTDYAALNNFDFYKQIISPEFPEASEFVKKYYPVIFDLVSSGKMPYSAFDISEAIFRKIKDNCLNDFMNLNKIPEYTYTSTKSLGSGIL